MMHKNNGTLSTQLIYTDNLNWNENLFFQVMPINEKNLLINDTVNLTIVILVNCLFLTE